MTEPIRPDTVIPAKEPTPTLYGVIGEMLNAKCDRACLVQVGSDSRPPAIALFLLSEAARSHVHQLSGIVNAAKKENPPHAGALVFASSTEMKEIFSWMDHWGYSFREFNWPYGEVPHTTRVGMWLFCGSKVCEWIAPVLNVLGIPCDLEGKPPGTVGEVAIPPKPMKVFKLPEDLTPLNLKAYCASALGMCGCFDREAYFGALRELLEWAGASKDDRPPYDTLYNGNTGVFYLLSGFLSQLRLIEEGTSSRHAFLREDGKRLLEAIQNISAEEFDTASGKAYDGVTYGID